MAHYIRSNTGRPFRVLERVFPPDRWQLVEATEEEHAKAIHLHILEEGCDEAALGRYPVDDLRESAESEDDDEKPEIPKDLTALDYNTQVKPLAKAHGVKYGSRKAEEVLADLAAIRDASKTEE